MAVQRAVDVGHLQFQAALRLGSQRVRGEGQRLFLPVLLQQRIGNLRPRRCIVRRTNRHVAQYTDGGFRPITLQQGLPQQRTRLVQFGVQRHGQHEIDCRHIIICLEHQGRGRQEQRQRRALPRREPFRRNRVPAFDPLRQRRQRGVIADFGAELVEDLDGPVSLTARRQKLRIGLRADGEARARLPDCTEGFSGLLVLARRRLHEAHHVQGRIVEARIAGQVLLQHRLGRGGPFRAKQRPGFKVARDHAVEGAQVAGLDDLHGGVRLAAPDGVHRQGQAHKARLAARVTGAACEASGHAVVTCQQGGKHRPLGHTRLFRRRADGGGVVPGRRLRVIRHRGEARDHEVAIGPRLVGLVIRRVRGVREGSAGTGRSEEKRRKRQHEPVSFHAPKFAASGRRGKGRRAARA